MKKTVKICIAILLFVVIIFTAGYILQVRGLIKISEKTTLPVPISKINRTSSQESDVTEYANPDMNLSFSYPTYLQVTTVRPHLIAVTNPFSTSTDSNLYIFETILVKGKNAVDIPFVIKGTLTKQTTIPVSSFTAKQLVYIDGKNETDFLTLRKGQEFIMVRIPKDSKDVEDAITDFVDSVKLLQ